MLSYPGFAPPECIWNAGQKVLQVLTDSSPRPVAHIFPHEEEELQRNWRRRDNCRKNIPCYAADATPGDSRSCSSSQGHDHATASGSRRVRTQNPWTAAHPDP